MPDVQGSPVKVFRHPLGLPGKKIKLSKDSHYQTPNSRGRPEDDRKHERSTRDRSPLGITINTDVSQHKDVQPQQTPSLLNNQLSPELHFKTQSQERNQRSPRYELSPFDREVPLVLSNNNTPKFTPAGASEQDAQGQSTKKPATPAIILESPKSVNGHPLRSGRVLAPARAASSVYTPALTSSAQPTPAPKSRRFPKLNLANIPSISKLGTPFSSIKTPMSVKTPSTSATMQFEDSNLDSPSTSKRGSPEDGPWKRRRHSLDTVPPTPRRSKGWWNLILSPLEAKRMTWSTKGSPKMVNPNAPEVPMLDRAAPGGASETNATDAHPVSAESRMSLMTLPHRNTIPYVGEAAKYYNPNERFGEDSPHLFAAEHDENDRSLEVEASNALSTKGPSGQRNVGTPEEVQQSGEPSAPTGVEQHEDTKAAGRPELARNFTPGPSENAGESAPHTVSKAAAIHPSERSHVQESSTAGPSEGQHYFSNLDSASSPVTHNGHTYHTAKSPDTPLTALSPGVVEVADARPFHTARSVHTKSYQRSPMPGSKAEKPITAKASSIKQPVAPNPKRPVLHVETARLEEAAHSHSQPEVNERFRFQKPKSRQKKKGIILERFHHASVATGVGFILLLIVVLCLTVTQHHADMPVAATWLNLTGYPALTTGIATIARPSVKSQSSCVSNTDLWTCALPKEQQGEVAPNGPDQPNMRLEIRYVGDKKLLKNSSSSRLLIRTLQSRSIIAVAKQSVVDNQLVERDGFSEITKAAIPAPPSDDEQAFLGNTTDNIAQPFVGEKTPFIVSFLPTINPSQDGHDKRDNNQNTGNPNPFESFPPPLLASNNTAATADLLPFPSGQPLKLFNRGKDSEHYGFYTYFDRSLFMKLSNSSSNSTDPANGSGGSTRQAANARCTWSQTRFLVQIWTKPSSAQQVSPSTGNGGSNATASAADFAGSGTFPLPVTVTLDRHGGDAGKKAVYCYGLDQYQRPISDQKGIVGEARDFGGTIVNPAPGAFTAVPAKNGGYGGVDGGTGGCSCQWTNW